jgi:hypothetical protein
MIKKDFDYKIEDGTHETNAQVTVIVDFKKEKPKVNKETSADISIEYKDGRNYVTIYNHLIEMSMLSHALMCVALDAFEDFCIKYSKDKSMGANALFFSIDAIFNDASMLINRVAEWLITEKVLNPFNLIDFGSDETEVSGTTENIPDEEELGNKILSTDAEFSVTSPYSDNKEKVSEPIEKKATKKPTTRKKTTKKATKKA